MQTVVVARAMQWALGVSVALVLSAASAAAQQKFHLLYSFGNSDSHAAGPQGRLVRDKNGNLFGTTSSGGLGYGTVYKLAPDGTETTLYAFAGGDDGYGPTGGLVMDKRGVLYGTTFYGGGTDHCSGIGCGTVFKLTTGGAESVIYAFKSFFAGGEDGIWPQAGLLLDKTGNVYGTTINGGTNGCSVQGCGTVFEITPEGKEIILHKFQAGLDGQAPYSDLLLDAKGNLFGTTLYGGSSNCNNLGCGTVFKIAKSGDESITYAFTGSGDGGFPYAGLIQDANGNYIGATADFGTHGNGTIFKLTPQGKETVLYAFKGGNDGSQPYAPIVMDASGNIFGTTEEGGGHGCSNGYGCGTVFKLAPNGTEIVLHKFGKGNTGEYPLAQLFLDSDGNLYGTATEGGPSNAGTLFAITN